MFILKCSGGGGRGNVWLSRWELEMLVGVFVLILIRRESKCYIEARSRKYFCLGKAVSINCYENVSLFLP